VLVWFVPKFGLLAELRNELTAQWNKIDNAGVVLDLSQLVELLNMIQPICAELYTVQTVMESKYYTEMSECKKWRWVLCLPTLGLSALGCFYMDYEVQYMNAWLDAKMTAENKLLCDFLLQ
jgi:hypothetical protein